MTIEHRAPISGVAAGPDGLVATAGYDNRLILWRGRHAVARAYHDHLVNQCAFDAGGRWLVSASSDYSARVWSTASLRLEAVLADHDDDVEMAVFDATAERVATASRDHRVRVFTRRGELVHRLAGHTADVISVAWSGDGALVSSSDDGTVRRWNAVTGALDATLPLGAETDTLVIAPDGSLFCGNDRGEIICVRHGGERRVPAHAAGIKRLALAGTRLVSSSYDRTLRIWEVRGDDLAPVCSTSLPAVIWARGVAIAPDGKILLGTFGSTYAAFDPATEAWDLRGIADTTGFNAVLADAGAIYAVGDAGRVVRDGSATAELGSSCNFLASWRGRRVAGGHVGALFDADTGAVLYQHRSPLNCAAVLADGDLLVGTYTGEGLRLGDAGLREVLALHDQAVKGIAVHGDTIFSVSAAGDAAVHRAGHAVRMPTAHDRIANGVCALADGRFATVSRDRTLRIWTADRAEVIATPHAHSIKCVAAAGDAIATGSYDGTIGLYRAGTWRVVRPTTAGISSLCADGTAVLAASYDGRVYRIDVATGDHRAVLSNSTTRQPSGST